MTPYKVHQIPFQKTFEQKRAPGGCSVLRVRLAFPLSAPRGIYLSKVTFLAGPQWQLGGRELCSAFFARQGRAPPARCIFQWVGTREQSYIAKCHILRNDLKIGPLKIAEFLHAAMNWWENEIILLTLFKIYTLCWPNTPFLGAKSGKNAFFRKKYPITPFLLGIRRSVWWGRWKGTVRECQWAKLLISVKNKILRFFDFFEKNFCQIFRFSMFPPEFCHIHEGQKCLSCQN